jgi:transcriptional regulator with XRE-family HTH domain
MIIFGNELKKARLAAGLTQAQVAEKIGISLGSMCFYENGTNIPSLHNFAKLVEVLNVDANKLLKYLREDI